MLTYKGKPLTVVTIEYLLLAFRKQAYYPPEGSDAAYIFTKPSIYCTSALLNCIEAYTNERVYKIEV